MSSRRAPAAGHRRIVGTLPEQMPLVRALVWFNVDKETNWAVNSSTASLAAFRGAVRQSIYAGTLPVS